MKALGVVLIVLGVIALIYQGITYTRDREVVEMGPIEVTAEEKETIPIPPIIGGVLVVAGVALLVAGRKRGG